MLDALAAADPLEHQPLVVLVGGRDEPHDRRPDHLVGGVAEHVLGAFVPGGDDAVEVLADDRVGGGVDDRGEAVRLDLGVPQLGDVADHADHLGDLAVVLSHFGTSDDATPENGDLDGDADVDLQDLAMLLADFGTPCG